VDLQQNKIEGDGDEMIALFKAGAYTRTVLSST